MRLVVLALALALAAPRAEAAPPPIAPDAWGEELLHIARARLADRRGDLDMVKFHYRRALEVKARANTQWFLADVTVRLGDYRQAISEFEVYKRLATTDAERDAADAEIAKIRALPYHLALSGTDAEPTVAFVDGEKWGVTPQARTLPEGWHVVDLVSATRYDHRRVNAEPMKSDHLEQRSLAWGRTGNVILAGDASVTMVTEWDHNGTRIHIPGRFTLPPGKTTLELSPSLSACAPLPLDVPRTGTLLVFLTKESKKDGCTSYAVKKHVVTP